MGSGRSTTPTRQCSITEVLEVRAVPIIQSLDMRGLHQRAESCLNAWLSTQGDSMPAGDYASKEGGFYHFWPNYTSCQGGVLWALAEHYLYTRDQDWLSKVAPQIVAGCDFILRERKRTMKELPGGRRPLWYGLAPAGCVADMRDWEYSFMLNAYFYLGLKKSAQVLQDVDAGECQADRGRGARLPRNDSPSSQGKRGAFSGDSSSRRDLRALGAFLCGFARAEHGC